jgi:glycosyltransferase involved in cell wall biosynthesis
MKILLIHNEYQQRGGEFQAVKNQIDLLNSQGYRVVQYIKDNRHIDSFSRIQLVSAIPKSAYSKSSYDEIQVIIEREKPDLAHVHNVFPLISPSIYHAIKSTSIPIVQTVHNFRFLCPNGLFFINDKPCEMCKRGNTSYAILKKCYRQSLGLSALYAVSIGGNRIAKTFDLVDQFIALTEFSARKMIESGLTIRNKIAILGNFIPDPLPIPGSEDSREDYVVYIGRLSIEKGVRIILEAGKLLTSTKILVIGSGPDYSYLENIIDVEGLGNIYLLGPIHSEEKWEYLRKASAVIIPSICYETFSIAAIEAMSVGTPVIASRLGSLPFVIDDGISGVFFEPGDGEDLARKITQLINTPELLNELGSNGRRLVDQNYSQESHFEKLNKIYLETLN